MEEALEALERPGARLLAGGTDLMVALRHSSPWAASVQEVVDIKGVAAAAGVRDEGSVLHVGALVTAAELECDPLVARFAPALMDAAARSSAPMLRARGTVGGNLVTPHPTPDVAAALLALDAVVRVVTASDGIDGVPVEAFLGGGERSGSGRPTSSRAMILAVEIPKGGRSAFEKIGLRGAFSRTSAAVGVCLRGGLHRVVLSGAADRPFVARAASAALDAGEDVAMGLAEDLERSDTGRGTGGRRATAQMTLLEELIGRARSRAASRAEWPEAGSGG